MDKDGNSVATLQDIDADDKLDYLKTSLKQMLLGNYTEDTNLLGTLGQVALGFLGLDLPADIRDLLYDITHWKLTPSHALQTILDAVALLPVVGSLKYTDEAIDAVKGVAKYGDDVAEEVVKTTKHGSERLIERNFSNIDIKNIKEKGTIKIQEDGAKVYIKETNDGRFDIIIEGENGIITALKNISKKSVNRLTKNYNWR